MTTLSLAKRDFELGYLTKYEIEREILGKGWYLSLSDGTNKSRLEDARKKEARVFKSLDSVITTLEEIGFEVNILS